VARNNTLAPQMKPKKEKAVTRGEWNDDSDVLRRTGKPQHGKGGNLRPSVPGQECQNQVRIGGIQGEGIKTQYRKRVPGLSRTGPENEREGLKEKVRQRKKVHGTGPTSKEKSSSTDTELVFRGRTEDRKQKVND